MFQVQPYRDDIKKKKDLSFIEREGKRRKKAEKEGNEELEVGRRLRWKE